MSTILLEVKGRFGCSEEDITKDMRDLAKRIGIVVRCEINGRIWTAYADGALGQYTKRDLPPSITLS